MLNFISKILNSNSTQATAVLHKPSFRNTVSAASLKRNPGSAPTLHSVTEGAQTPELRMVKLIMVTANNNNKFYEMEELGDGNFKVSYGRVGNKPAQRTYPMSQWDGKRREKIRKGYKDTTHLFADKADTVDFAEMTDVQVRELMNNLMQYAQNSVFKNYRVSSADVTLQQVTEAQNILDKLSAAVAMNMDADDFNWHLTELFAVIPRKMSHVKNHLIEVPQSPEDLSLIETQLAEEQATLDVMRGQVEMHQKQQDNRAETPQTLTEAFGIHVESTDDPQIIAAVKKMMGDKAKHFHRAYQVVNLATQEKFDRHLAAADNPETELFWHGSRNENWLSILKTGLVLRPANAIINGKMFGYGLYFADKFAKSLNYTSLRGSYWAGGTQQKAYLALYEVHTGNRLRVKSHQPWCGQLNAENLKKRGRKYNSVFAQGGADLINNEYIVYHEHQCTVRYLVEVR